MDSRVNDLLGSSEGSFQIVIINNIYIKKKFKCTYA